MGWGEGGKACGITSCAERAGEAPLARLPQGTEDGPSWVPAKVKTPAAMLRLWSSWHW